MSYPEQLRYTAEHEWARLEADGTISVGITAHAQDALGDVVFLELPDVGTALTAGQVFGVVESVKAVSDLYAPLAGTVVATNDPLAATPEILNSDPYEAGWMLRIEPSDPAAYGQLMDAAAYAALVASTAG